MPRPTGKLLGTYAPGDHHARAALLAEGGALRVVSVVELPGGRRQLVHAHPWTDALVVVERVIDSKGGALWLCAPSEVPPVAPPPAAKPTPKAEAPAVADAPAGASAGHRWGVALLRRVAVASPEATLRAFVAAARAQGAVASLCHHGGQPVIVVKGRTGALVHYYPRFLGGRLVLGFQTVSGPLEAASPAEAA